MYYSKIIKWLIVFYSNLYFNMNIHTTPVKSLEEIIMFPIDLVSGPRSSDLYFLRYITMWFWVVWTKNFLVTNPAAQVPVGSCRPDRERIPTVTILRVSDREN